MPAALAVTVMVEVPGDAVPGTVMPIDAESEVLNELGETVILPTPPDALTPTGPLKPLANWTFTVAVAVSPGITVTVPPPPSENGGTTVILAVADFCRLEPGMWAEKPAVPPVVAPEAIVAVKVAVLLPASTVTLPGETVMLAAALTASTITGPLYPAALPTVTSIATVPVGKVDPPEVLADSTASRTLTFTVRELVRDSEVAVNTTVPSAAPAAAAMV
jgi:hypothetical protein